MARKKRRAFSPEFKAKIACEALKERESIATIAQKYDLQPTQVSKWKKEFIQNRSLVFEKPESMRKKEKEQEGQEEKLFAEIGRLKMELDWLKKKTESLD